MRGFRCPGMDQFTLQFTARDVDLIEQFIRHHESRAREEDRRRIPGWNPAMSNFADQINREMRANRQRADAQPEAPNARLEAAPLDFDAGRGRATTPPRTAVRRTAMPRFDQPVFRPDGDQRDR